MADLADVEMALVDAIIAAIPANGITISGSGTAFVRIYRGFPTNASLVADRDAGTMDIGVHVLNNSTRNTTRWGIQSMLLPNLPTLTASYFENRAEFSGSASAGDIAGILINQNTFLYQTQIGDSAALVASALADAVRTIMTCWLTETTITVPQATTIVARIASHATILQEWSRQEQGFQVSIFAPSPALRDSAASLINGSLAQINFLTLPDGTAGRLKYRSSANTDANQGASVYRRDIVYEVEYGTTSLANFPSMLFGDLAWNGTTIYA